MRFAIGTCLICFIFVGAKGQDPTPTPIQIREEVIVTANRTETRLGETAASVTTFSRSEIESAAAPTVDDVLRQSVGFSIFRRSSSRNANPTTQGVSLRGVGASGASRSIVLFDGVPLNDPFGGWVQWNRVPSIAIERVEVLRGGASSLYGEASLSGAVNLIPRKAEDKSVFAADVFAGTQKTFSGAGFAGFISRGWAGDLIAASFQTRGFIPVDETVRGPVDAFAGVRSQSFSGKLTRDLGERASLFVRPSWFGEVRTNGTGLQTNRSHIRSLILGGNVRLGPAKAAQINWRAFGAAQVYDQIFSAIAGDRTSESLTRTQRVPAKNVGLSVQASGVYRLQTLVGGVELRRVEGTSDEVAYASGRPTALVGAGGSESTAGVFLQDILKVEKRIVLVLGIRFDHWRNYKAASSDRSLISNLSTITLFPDRVEHAVSPRVAILYSLSDEVSIYANTSLSFRAPTLNELYRSFRVGNVLTLANERLRAEHAKNVEGGLSFSRHRTVLRANGFWTEIDEPIANVTLAISPSLITRQRQNAGRTRSRGIELEAGVPIGKVNLSAGYMWVDSRVTSFPSNPALEGRMVPQIARHQVTFQVLYAPKNWTVGVQGRASSEQFDDDLNLLRLEPYAQMDVFASRRLSEKLHIYAAVENVFNSRYSVGKTPVRTVGSPANLRLGIKWR